MIWRLVGTLVINRYGRLRRSLSVVLILVACLGMSFRQSIVVRSLPRLVRRCSRVMAIVLGWGVSLEVVVLEWTGLLLIGL